MTPTPAYLKKDSDSKFKKTIPTLLNLKNHFDSTQKNATLIPQPLEGYILLISYFIRKNAMHIKYDVLRRINRTAYRTCD